MLAAVLAALVACGGGGGGGDDGGGSTADDTTPNAFSFTDETQAAPGIWVSSNTITISGIDAAAPVSITGGEYALDAGTFTSSSGSVSSGQTVVVRVMSSQTPGATQSATLTVGGVGAAFNVTTAAEVTGNPQPQGSQNWSMFGRDYSHSRASDGTTIGADDVDSLRVVARVPGAGVSGTPAVANGVVYYSDYGGSLKAVDAVTGSVIWSRQLQAGMLTPSAFVAGDRVYIGGDASNVYAVDRATGDVVWSTDIESTPFDRIWSSPVVVGDTLIIGAASYQVFFPVDVDDELFRGSVVGLDTTDGSIRWRVSVCPPGACGGGVSVWSSTTIDPELGLAYIGTGQAYRDPAGPYSDALVAIDYQTGTFEWHHQFTANDVYTIDGGSLDRDLGAPPNLFEATIDGVVHKLVGAGDKDGQYKAFDRATGAVVWEQDVGPGSPIGGIMGAPAVAGGRIYFTSNTSTVGTGRGDARPGTATAYALNAATGDIVWSTDLPAGGFSGNAVANGLLYFITWDGQLRVLDAGDGTLLRSIPVGTEIGTFVGDSFDGGFPNGSTSGPAIANGRIYAGYGWTWGANVAGGLAILEADSAPPPPLRWTPSCPDGFAAQMGLNSGFVSDGVAREFHILPATTGSGPRPVFVALTGTVEPELSFVNAAQLDELPAQGWHVVVPVRNCVTQGHACDAVPPPTGDGRTWEPWFDGANVNDQQFWQDEGPDVRFFERAVRCAATAFEVDQSRIFIGGISAGGTATNRALTFNSDFFAGGVTASGEWYRVDLASLNGPEPNVSTPVADGEIIEGRCCPRPLPDDLGHSVNIVVWGGPNDIWPPPPADPLANYGPSTKLASNYYATQPDVVTVSCSGTHGHLWPRDAAFTVWLAETLAAHPKGTPKHAFVLTDPPNGYSCVLGSYKDH